jgi:PIN domain nuclease of toxin-antitoxin system
MQERMEFRTSLEKLSDAEKLEAITARMTEAGLSQQQIDERIAKITQRMSLHHQ